MIIESRALWLARIFALSRYNHRSQIFWCFGVRNWSILLFSRIIVNVIILKQLVTSGDVNIGEYDFHAKKMRFRSRPRAQVRCCKSTVLVHVLVLLRKQLIYLLHRTFFFLLIKDVKILILFFFLSSGSSSAVLSHGVIFIHLFIILFILFIYNIFNYIYLSIYLFILLLDYPLTGLLVFTWTPSTSSSEFLPSWHLPTVAEENNLYVILSLLNCLITRFVPERTVHSNWWKNCLFLQLYFYHYSNKKIITEDSSLHCMYCGSVILLV